MTANWAGGPAARETGHVSPEQQELRNSPVTTLIVSRTCHVAGRNGKGGCFLVPSILQPGGCNVVPTGRTKARTVVALWLRFGSNHSSTTVANCFVFSPPISRMVEFWLAFGCNQNPTFLLHLHLHITPLYPPSQETPGRDFNSGKTRPELFSGLRSPCLYD